MQDNTSDNLDLYKRQTYSGQYGTPLPPDGGTWDQLEKGKS